MLKPFFNLSNKKSNRMKTRVVMLLGGLLFTFFGFAQLEGVDLDQFITETQQSSSAADEMRIVWWIPVEFWDITFQNDPATTKEQADQIVDVLKPYTIFAVVDGEIGPFGGVTYKSVESIKNGITLIDNENITYKSLDTENLNADVQNLISAFKPILGNMMGQLGENMHFFVFTDEKNKKERVSDPWAKGFVRFQLYEAEYKWRTPVGSLLPLKVCPEDGEKLKGSWDYCPWHGEKLIDAEE